MTHDSASHLPERLITLDEARRLYVETRTPVRAIAEALRMSPPSFRKLRASLGWPARHQIARPPRRERRRLGRPPTLTGLVHRLRRQIGRRLTELEAAESAAGAGEYAALLRAMTELTRLETREPLASTAGAGEGSDGGPDPDALREAIARRVESFGRLGPAPGLPGDAAAG